MRRFSMVATGLILIAGCTTVKAPSIEHAASSTALTGKIPLTAASWVSVPDADNIAQHYPELAHRKSIEGFVRLRCHPLTTGVLVNCAVVEEAPLGYGFAGATVAVFSKASIKPGFYGPDAYVEPAMRWRLGYLHPGAN